MGRDMKKCSVNQCDKKHYAFKMCEMHYKRFKRTGTVEKTTLSGIKNPGYKHGMHGTRIYKIWRGMFDRCGISKSYKDVKVCEEWNDFRRFLKDMGNSYDDTLTIDRINPFSDYSLENCRWIPVAEQRRNLRNNRKVIYRGKSILVVELAEKTGMPYRTLYQRLFRYGWSVEDAVNKIHRRKVFINESEE